MATQTDIKAKYASSTGALSIGGTTQGIRIKGIWVVTPVGAGSVVITDGGSSGPQLIKLDTAAAITNDYLLLPGEGVRFAGDPYVTLSSVTSVTIFYG